MSWEKCKLSDCCISIADGDHQPPPKSETGIPFVTIANITGQNQFDFENTMFVPEEYYNNLDDKRKAKPGDILYSVVGSFGIPVLITEEKPFVFQRHIAILRPNEKILPQYLYYTMKSSAFYAMADAAAIGAAQRTISLSALRNMTIELPPISIQQKIVSVLAPYDGMVQNNHKQIKLLEEAAQRLYKEWFVDLHFPGYENTPVVDGIPEGWQRSQAEAFFKITIGKTPPRSEQKWFVSGNAGIPWVSISDMGSNGVFLQVTSEGLTEEAIQKNNIKIVPVGTILVSFKLTVGRVSITSRRVCTNEAIAHFHIGQEYLKAYTFCYLKNFEYETLGNTSSISKAVNSKIIKAMTFVMPEEKIVKAFSDRITPILNAIETKQNIVQRLIETRDRLLPKLMNGEIEA